jgi:predicted ABC-class ATPase
MERLKRILEKIDGLGYKAYKEIKGKYHFEGFILFIDHVQGDPFASPTRVRVRVPQNEAKFPPELFQSKIRSIAVSDYLTRQFASATRTFSKGKRGTGRSGEIYIDIPGQEVLERTSVVINHEFVEARIWMGLPAAGRRILGKEAAEMFWNEIPKIVKSSMLYKNLNHSSLLAHVYSIEDQDFLRRELPAHGLVSFIGNNSILPRMSGVDQRPLKKGAIPFKSPPELEQTFHLPNRGVVQGMGIPAGVTLIVGGGFHGKSTLLNAIELGVYNHIPGDGRELVATISSAVKIRAENGRAVTSVDISPFINNLPLGKDTESFSTENASGSTSQAANIIEALEIGSKLLLIDEDTSATNFMIRDKRMQKLVTKEKEPITPLIDKVRLLYKDYGLSTILVMGGCGDYFDCIDTCILMDEYRAVNVTQKAKDIAKRYETHRVNEGGGSFGSIKPRAPLPESFRSARGKREVKISIKGKNAILYGRDLIDLSSIEQIVSESQTRAIGDAIFYLSQKYMDGKRTLSELLELLRKDIEREGLEIINPFGQITGDYALPRKEEVAFAINRLRRLKVRRLS